MGGIDPLDPPPYLRHCAAGMMVPPMIVFNYERVPPHIINLMPSKWGIGKTDSGWMTAKSIYKYVTNIFYPWLVDNNIETPIIFFVDGHASHLTLNLSDFCREKGIILTALFPNGTHIIPPLDVGVFRALKMVWKNCVHKWRMDSQGQKVKRENFGTILKDALTCITSNVNENSFRTTGLYPFDANAIDYNKYFKAANTITAPQGLEVNNIPSRYLKFIEDNIPEGKLQAFKQIPDDVWNRIPEDKSLFNFWLKISVLFKNKQNSDDDNTHTDGIMLPTSTSKDETQVENVIEFENVNVEDEQTAEDDVTTKTDLDINHVEQYNIADTEHTPEKESHEVFPESSIDVPTPFKKCLFWPEPSTSMKSKRSKEKIPSVAVSDSWRQYYLAKQTKKENEEKAKEERKRKREEKRILDQSTKEQKRIEKIKRNLEKNSKKIKKDDTSSESSVEICLESEGEGDDWMNESGEIEMNYNGPNSISNEDNSDEDCYKINDYVILKYEGTFFPGKMTNIKPGKLLIMAMAVSGINTWKWPNPKDEIWYTMKEDVVKKILEPSPVNKRGVYKVPEIDKFNIYYVPK